MKIAMANDHAGTKLKNEIKAYLESEGHEVKDFGTYDEESCDLSDFVYPAALAVAKGECDRGIFVDGVGYGSAMIANKTARHLRRRLPGPVLRGPRPPAHDSNVLCLGGKIIGPQSLGESSRPDAHGPADGRAATASKVQEIDATAWPSNRTNHHTDRKRKSRVNSGFFYIMMLYRRPCRDSN